MDLKDENEIFGEFLSSDHCSRIMRKNKLSIHIETINICYNNLNTNKIIYDFIVAQQDTRRKLLYANFIFCSDFKQSIRKCFVEIDSQNDDRYDLLTNKNAKFLFC